MTCNYCKSPATVQGRDFNGIKKVACQNHLKNMVEYSQILTKESQNETYGAIASHASLPAPTVNEPGPGPEELALRSVHPAFRPDMRPFVAK